MQSEKGNISGLDIALICSSGFVRQTIGFNTIFKDRMMPEYPIAQTANRSIAAVECHEHIMQCIWVFILNMLLKHIFWNSIIDIQQHRGLH